MKKALKVTFGTMVAVSLAAPVAALAVTQHPHHHHHHHKHQHAHHHHSVADQIAAWVDVTYMRPSNNGLSVGDYATPPTQVNFDGAHNHYFLEPNNDWDYALGISYRLPHHHTRIFLSYDHYVNNQYQGDTDLRNLGLFPLVDGVLESTVSTTDYELKYHEIRLGAIHDLHFGDRFCLDVSAFFEYDRLRQQVGETNAAVNGTQLGRTTENKVWGFGPGFGFMSHWFFWGPHWQAFAGANTAIIQMDNKFTQRLDGLQGGIVGNVYDYEPTESDSLVGKVDIEFGLKYSCAFRREMHGMKWDVSLGMKYMNMFNVFKNGNTMYQPHGGSGLDDSPVVLAGFAPYLGAAQDWGKYGPFLRFKLGGHNS